jgi:hypothetical protein
MEIIKSDNLQNNAVFIIGMHRNGTSVLTRILNLMGMHLGNGFMIPGNKYNISGHWELGQIVRANEELLDDLYSAWDDVCPLSEGWQAAFNVSGYKEKISHILDQEFADSRLWGVKDPRISRLLPVWESILKDRPVKSHYLIMVRNPVEVAMSLEKRDGFSSGKSYLLWLRYMLEAEKQTRGKDRLFVSYQDMLSDWKILATKIENAFGFTFPDKVEDAADSVETFLQKSLRHNVADNSALKSVHPFISDVYDALKQAVAGHEQECITIMDAVGSEINKSDTLYVPAIYALQDKNEISNESLLEQNRNVARMELELKNLEQISFSRQGEIKQLEKFLQKAEKNIAHIENELKKSGQISISRQKEIIRLQKSVETSSNDSVLIASLRQSLEQSQQHIRAVEHSISCRLGWVLTFPLRLLRDIIRGNAFQKNNKAGQTSSGKKQEAESIDSLRQSLEQSRQHIRAVEHSISFRLGWVLTFPLRLLRDIIKGNAFQKNNKAGQTSSGKKQEAESIDSLRQSLEHSRQHIRAVEHSISFRLGWVLTFPLRLLRDIIRGNTFQKSHKKLQPTPYNAMPPDKSLKKRGEIKVIRKKGLFDPDSAKHGKKKDPPAP